MPHNTPRDVHVNKALTNFSVAYRQDQKNYVATRWAPIVPVNKQSDLYFTFSKGDTLRNVAEVRAPASESAGSDVKISTGGPYYCDVVAIHTDLDMDMVANADEPLNPKRAATRNVVQWLMTEVEIKWATAQFKAGVWGIDWTGNTSPSDPAGLTFLRWSDPDSDPIQDIDAAKDVLHAATGKFANKMTISYDVYRVLKNHPKLIDRIKYTQRGAINSKNIAGILADLLEIDEVLVASAIYNSAAEGATDSITRVMKNGCLIGYVNPAPAIESPSASYTFVWNDLFGQVQDEPEGMGIRMLDYPLIWKKAHRVEGEMPYDLKIISSDCGIFLDKVLTA